MRPDGDGGGDDPGEEAKRLEAERDKLLERVKDLQKTIDQAKERAIQLFAEERRQEIRRRGIDSELQRTMDAEP
jgi:hypothetical protein